MKWNAVERARWDGAAGEVISIVLPEVVLGRLLHDEARTLRLRTAHAPCDSAVAPLVAALWHEASVGGPLGALYAQGLTLALLGVLGARYGDAPQRPMRRAGRFGPRDAARLRDMVAAHLSADLRIERLAELVSMSPHHFARTFKATFAQTPHAYVLERRIEAACRALRTCPARTVAEIASDCGFASQAHFTEVFRRRIGAAPARWRKA